MRNISQVNEALRHELAPLLIREVEFPNGLLTITDVDCTSDLKYAKVWVSVLPISVAGSALKILRQKSSFLGSLLRKRLKIGRIPKINWMIDSTESRASILERAIAEDNEEIISLKD